MSSTANEILDSAERLTRSEGYNGFSFRDIAEEVGIKSASVHYHFPTKAGLGAAVARRYTDRFMAALGAPEDTNRTPDDLLQQYVSLYRASLADDGLMCLCGMLAAEVASLPQEVAAEAKRFFEKNLDWLVRVLSRPNAVTADGQEQARTRALHLIATLEGAMLVARTLNGPADFDDIVREFTRRNPPTVN